MNFIRKLTSKLNFVGGATTSTDQQPVKNGTEILSKIGRNLYLNAEKADVYFTFEGEQSVPAHKIILSSGSDVFDTMFYGSLKEEGEIHIVDSTAAAFEEFLRFFYFDKVDGLRMEHVSEIMYLSKKYNVTECHRMCASLAESNISDDTVLSTLNLAIIHEHEQLQGSCESFIATNLQEILESENFLACDRRVLECILKMDFLPCSETQLFEACMSWVRTTTGEDQLTRDIVRTVLGNLFYEFRFGTTSLEEFGKLLPEYGELFSPNEYSEILQMISGQETEPHIFKACRRLHPSCNEAKLIRCDRSLSRIAYESHCSIGTEEVTQFSADARLLLGHFTIAPIYSDIGRTTKDFDRNQIQTIPNVKVTIVADSSNILTQFVHTLDLSFVDQGYKVHLPRPMYIQPKKNYEIRITFPTTDKPRFLYTEVRSIVATDPTDHDIRLLFYNDVLVNGLFIGLIKSVGFNFVNSG